MDHYLFGPLSRLVYIIMGYSLGDHEVVDLTKVQSAAEFWGIRIHSVEIDNAISRCNRQSDPKALRVSETLKAPWSLKSTSLYFIAEPIREIKECTSELVRLGWYPLWQATSTNSLNMLSWRIQSTPVAVIPRKAIWNATESVAIISHMQIVIEMVRYTWRPEGSGKSHGSFGVFYTIRLISDETGEMLVTRLHGENLALERAYLCKPILKRCGQIKKGFVIAWLQ